MYFWNLQYLDKLGWFVCLDLCVCVALRLARFNVNSEEEPSWKDNFFEGCHHLLEEYCSNAFDYKF